MTLLHDNTQFLLATEPRADHTALDQALENLSASVVTHHALLAKAKAYQSRVDRELATAANRGAGLGDLAAAAGVSTDEALARLRATPPGLLEPATGVRLGVNAAAPAPSSMDSAGTGRARGWSPLKRP